VRRELSSLGRYVKPGAAAAGLVIVAGLAGWGGSTIALNGTGTSSTPVSASAAKTFGSVGPATSGEMARPTEPMPPTATGTTGSGSSPAGRTGAAPWTSSAPNSVPSSGSTLPRGTVRGAPPHGPSSSTPDIAFVAASSDSIAGQWHYRVWLLGFPADTVVEISGFDTLGNLRAAPLAMTTADGSWDPFTAGFGVLFAYGGTCSAAQPLTVTARGHGFSVTETVPRPLECDGGATGNGPWSPPIQPQPVPTPAPTSAPPSQ
jgi:hypothetical protein